MFQQFLTWADLIYADNRKGPWSYLSWHRYGTVGETDFACPTRFGRCSIIYVSAGLRAQSVAISRQISLVIRGQTPSGQSVFFDIWFHKLMVGVFISTQSKAFAYFKYRLCIVIHRCYSEVKEESDEEDR